MSPDAKGAILVVDDEEPIGKLMTSWLSEDGYDVAYANGFAQVQEFFADRSFDLVTLDSIMPEVSGLQVLTWLGENHPDTGVIMATAMGDLDTVLEAMRAGAVNYLRKPFNLELVSAEVERAMERQVLIAENRAYQRDLEKRVGEQTAEIRAAHAELEFKVKELEGRDRLIQCQMKGPTEEEAGDVILRVLADVLDLKRAAILRPGADGELVLSAGADFVALTEQDEPTSLTELDTTTAMTMASRARATGEATCDEERGQGAVPLAYQQQSLGAIWIDGIGGNCHAEGIQTLSRLGQQAALTLCSAGICAALDQEDLGLGDLLEIE